MTDHESDWRIAKILVEASTNYFESVSSRGECSSIAHERERVDGESDTYDPNHYIIFDKIRVEHKGDPHEVKTGAFSSFSFAKNYSSNNSKDNGGRKDASG